MFEAKVLIERWRKEYNTFRSHSALGYLPPAPETVEAVCLNTNSSLRVAQRVGTGQRVYSGSEIKID